jgi:hypothetical protein
MACRRFVMGSIGRITDVATAWEWRDEVITSGPSASYVRRSYVCSRFVLEGKMSW